MVDPALLHRRVDLHAHHHRGAVAGDTNIFHGHGMYKELVFMLLVIHMLLIGVLYWLYLFTQAGGNKQSSKQKAARKQRLLAVSKTSNRLSHIPSYATLDRVETGGMPKAAMV